MARAGILEGMSEYTIFDVLKEAGTMVFFAVATGAAAIGWSVGFAYRPTSRKRRVTFALIRVTLFEGVFGFLAGMINVFRVVETLFAGGETPWWQVFIIGTKEASNNLFMAVGLSALAALFLAVGEARSAPDMP